MSNTNKKQINQAASSGLGLDDLGDLSSLLNAPISNNDNGSGKIEVSINLIDEDPNQPRRETNPGFSEEKLGELAGSIHHRGVKTPISVRNHPTTPGRYMINDGARRYRASKIAGLTTIPVFIDNDYTSFDQIVANLIREGNTPREIADKIEVALKQGMKKVDIAAASGKTPGWVTLHAALLHLPKPLDDAFNSGRITDINIIYELVKIYKSDSEEVEKWLSIEDQEFTRGQLKLFRDFLADKHSKEEEIIGIVPSDQSGSDNQEDEEEITTSSDSGTGAIIIDQTIDNEIVKTKPDDIQDSHDDKTNNAKTTKKNTENSSDATDRFKKAIVLVQYDDRPARLVLDRRPQTNGWAWLKYEDDGHTFEANLSNVILVELIEG